MATTLKFRGQEGFDAIDRHLHPDDPGAERQNIGVIMQPGQTRHRRIGAKGGAHCLVPVGGNRNPDPGPADDDPSRGIAFCNSGTHGLAEFGIIYGIFCVRPEIEPLHPVGKMRLQGFLEIKARMVG